MKPVGLMIGSVRQTIQAYWLRSREKQRANMGETATPTDIDMFMGRAARLKDTYAEERAAARVQALREVLELIEEDEMASPCQHFGYPRWICDSVALKAKLEAMIAEVE